MGFGGIVFVHSPNDPGKRLLVSLEVWNLTEGSGSNSWWVGCEGYPVMALVFLRQEMAAIVFWAVLITLCPVLSSGHSRRRARSPLRSSRRSAGASSPSYSSSGHGGGAAALTRLLVWWVQV